MIFKCLSK